MAAGARKGACLPACRGKSALTCRRAMEASFWEQQRSKGAKEERGKEQKCKEAKEQRSAGLPAGERGVLVSDSRRFRLCPGGGFSKCPVGRQTKAISHAYLSLSERGSHGWAFPLLSLSDTSWLRLPCACGLAGRPAGSPAWPHATRYVWKNYTEVYLKQL